jgi:hypothetical protein
VPVSEARESAGVPLEKIEKAIYWILSWSEFAHSRSRLVISSWGGRGSAPFVFTEQGVATLSSVLRSFRPDAE